MHSLKKKKKNDLDVASTMLYCLRYRNAVLLLLTKTKTIKNLFWLKHF